MNNKAHLRPKDYDSNGDIIPMEIVAGKCPIEVGGNCPLRAQGEWIMHINDIFPCESTQECPFCHAEQSICGNDDNFCPNCGAKMKGGADMRKGEI